MPPRSGEARVAEHQAGDLIADRYRLVRKLGEGGMGVVWVAHSKVLDVDVALKVLRREGASQEAVERMAREARAAAQLGHPALVRVLDFGTSEAGDPFLAMELLQGDELHALLKQERRLAAVRAAGLLLPIIDGLGTAHAKGIVHRDIKPENIFIARDQQGRLQPKVLDFGIAKLDEKQTNSRLTQLGAVLGSPQYFSPEQAEGMDDVDFRTDIWSVGVMLYELVTGTTPFQGSNYNALIRSIVRDQPKPITEHAAGDAQFWTIIERCLKKDPAERWGSMWELGEAIALWMFERGERVDAASRSLKHGWLDGGVTGLQILVPSVAPSGPATDPPPEDLPATDAPAPDPSLRAMTVLTPRRRRRKLARLAWFALAALLAGGAAGVWLFRRPAPAITAAPKPISAPAAAPTPVTEVPQATAVSPTVGQPLIPAPDASSGSNADAPVSAGSAAPKVSARPSPGKSKPAPTGAARSTSTSSPTPISRPHDVFGF